MRDDLYFIPIIEQAMRPRDPRAALAEGFRRVRSMGAENRYQLGFDQFGAFMSVAAQAAPLDIGVVVFRDGSPVGSVRSGPRADRQVLRGITPGEYAVQLETGRLLWEGELTKSHLVWAAAFPGRPVRFAADTGEVAGASTLDVELLGGEMFLKVFPGIESGMIEIEMLWPRTH